MSSNFLLLAAIKLVEVFQLLLAAIKLEYLEKFAINLIEVFHAAWRLEIYDSKRLMKLGLSC
jgi:hypothetical protein